LLPDRLRECQDAAQSAALALIHGRELIDVVNLEQSDFDIALSLFLCSNGKDRGDEEDQSQRHSARRHQTGVHPGNLEYEFGAKIILSLVDAG
jgi:hypothetical protein